MNPLLGLEAKFTYCRGEIIGDFIGVPCGKFKVVGIML
jgi:hypothetical protein